jgi:hypothetical protein
LLLDQGKNPHPKHNQEAVKITIADLYRQYISGKKTPLSDSTVYAYKSWMNNHFKDWLTPREPMQRIADRITELATATLGVEDQGLQVA